MSTMEMRLSDQQKKILEKVYNKVFEGSADEPSLTDEGRMLCKKLNINPDDIKIWAKADFRQAETDVDEVIQIRYDHYR